MSWRDKGGQRSARAQPPPSAPTPDEPHWSDGLDITDSVGRCVGLHDMIYHLSGGKLAAATAREGRQILAAYREQISKALERPALPVRYHVVRDRADALRFAGGPIDIEGEGEAYRLFPILRSHAEILDDYTTQKTLVHGGVGSAKSIAGVLWHLDRCLRNGDYLNYFVAPDSGYLRDVILRHFRFVLSGLGVWHKCTWFKRDMDLVVRGLGPEFTVSLRSAEASNAGRNLSHFTMDEAELIKVDVAEDLMERLREPRAAVKQALFLCAPDGIGSWAHRWFYTDPLPNARAVRLSTRDNLFLPPDYITDSLSHLTGASRERYIEGHFVASQGRVFDRYLPGVHDSIPVIYDPAQADEYIMGCDFGSGCSFFSLFARVGDVMLCIDEVVKEDTDTFEMSDLAIAKWREIFDGYGFGALDRYGTASRVTCVIDPAGGATMKTSISDAAALERAGFRVLYHARHRNVRDGVLAVSNKLLKDEFFVDAERAQGVHRAMMYQQYDKLGRPEKGAHGQKSKALDHAADSIRYPTEYFFPVPGFAPSLHILDH
jgi:hypothetical protein